MEAKNGGEDGSNGETITSINLQLKGFEAGSLGANVRYRAKELGTNTPKVRIDVMESEDILIFNYDENAEYAYYGSSWNKFPLTQTNSYAGLSEKIQEWAQKGKGTHEVTFNEFSVEIIIDNVNPSLDDNLFTPPENADVEEHETV